ncbi:MAG: Na+/H+ antiporter NhaC family protein [Clostridiales bacterium]|nr:Na+/H+ antiporter NhaC family protein [Clostridiales bacterium]
MKNFIKFTPVFVLALMMILGAFGVIEGMDLLIAAPIATIAAIIVSLFVEGITFKDCIDAAMGSVSKILIALFILMFAYAMASVFMSSGVAAAIINVALGMGVTAKTVAVVGLGVTAVLSVATGSSWSTFAACAPIFLWLSDFVGGDLILTTCAIAGGACFGDNIGLISDTTIVSSGIQGVEVVDRIRTQGVWSVLCLVAAGIVFFLVGAGLETTAVDATTVVNQMPEEVWTALQEERPAVIPLLEQVRDGVPLYMVVPLILVIIVAIMGLNTFVCLSVGIVSAYLLGLVANTTGALMPFLTQCADGFADAGSWVIVMMMWIAAFGGIMARIAAFEPLSKLILKISKNVRQLMFFNGLLCIAGNAALADEMAQIVTVGPITKDLVEENLEGSEEDMYKIKLRNATFGDAMGVFGSQLIPWHCYLAFYSGIAYAVYPLHKFVPTDFIQYNFMAMIAVASLLILTITGFDRFIPLFGMPAEPQVTLKDKSLRKTA